jgi:hypothetical protein
VTIDFEFGEIDYADLPDDIPPPPPRRGAKPIAIANNDVKVRGEELHPIWWRGARWAVTAYGIECLDGTYAIERNRLLEDLPDFSWPQHMAGKIWVDIDEFATAWLIGLLLHGYGRKIKPAQLRDVCGRLPERPM